MSLSRIVTVFCDVVECGHWIGERRYAAEARGEARRAGWRRVDGEDICPRHEGQVGPLVTFGSEARRA